MAKGFALLGLILVVISATLTVGINLVIGFVGLFFATIGALGGDKMFSIAAVGVFLVNLFLMSPLTLGLLLGGSVAVSWITDMPALGWLIAAIVFALMPVAAMILHGTGKLVFGRREQPSGQAPDLTDNKS